MSSKFYGIQYPFFGSYTMYEDLIFDGTRIFVKKPYIFMPALLDDRQYSESTYLERLFHLEVQEEYPRYNFSVTVRDLPEILNAKPRWGIDNSGKIFDFGIKETYPFQCKKVIKINKDLIWVHGVSYPFKISEHLITKNIIELYAHLLYIDKAWLLFKFTYEYNNKTKYRI